MKILLYALFLLIGAQAALPSVYDIRLQPFTALHTNY